MKKNVSYEAIMRMLEALEDLLNNYEAGYTQEQWADKDKVDKLRKAHVKEAWLEICTVAEVDCTEEQWDIVIETSEELHRRVKVFCSEEV